MNYRHLYHAGSIADVFKHVVLLALLERLQQKPAGIFVLDTHAGIGLYDLSAPQAVKTGEWQSGIGRFMAAADACDDPLLGRYRSEVDRINGGGSLQLYPGSPRLIADLLRPQGQGCGVRTSS